MAQLSGQPHHPNLNDPTTESTTTITAPPMFIHPYDISSTLILPRDWPNNFYYPDTHFDFQSNHLETHAAPELEPDVIPSLAGLGIKNIDLCDADDPHFSDDLQYPDSEHFERRQIQRPYRTESVYDVERDLGDAHTFQAHFPGSAHSPWSLATFLKVAELEPISLPEEYSAFNPSLASSLELDIPGLASQTSQSSNDDLALSFEKLSAATGLSVVEFAAKISATAEATLKRMAEGADLGPQTAVAENTEALRREVSSWPPIDSRTPPVALPLADINMRISESSWNAGAFGVDPAEILPPSPPAEGVHDGEGLEHVYSVSGECIPELYHQQAQYVPLHIPTFSFELQYSTLPHDLPSPIQERFMLPMPVHSPPPPPPPSLPALDYVPESNPPSDDERSLFQSPSCSEYSPPMPSVGTKRTQSSRVSTRRTINRLPAEETDVGGYDYPDDMTEQQLQNLPPINLGTPVLDAHRGIALEELKAKAERYRLRNQGRDYDKRWLISFAGKLTHRGELLEEFRCYVTGCKQVNKRRDHILIHVGAHLDQRPFKCMHCSSRFLRKNECKRHELSHTGVRPFACHLCPSPATTFVRQDLLKRHMKRTHRIDFKFEKENEEPQRPKKRARH